MQTKDRILEAATSVVARDGSNKLTLEAVATEAGISKGGLLYHFPSKRALLEGMLSAMLQRMRVSVAEKREQDQYCNNFIAAYIDSQLDGSREDGRHILALLAAAAQDPTLLADAREQNTQWLQKATDQSELATALLLAAHGVRLLDHLQMLPDAPNQAEHYYQLLARVAEAV